jgi:hypothetical protein
MATSTSTTNYSGYKAGKDSFAQAAAQYAPGGGYTKGVEAMLDRLMKKSLASGMSNLVSSGLAGTSMAGGLANKFAEETAAPQLAQAESERAKSLADVLMNQGNFAAQFGGTTQTNFTPNSSGYGSGMMGQGPLMSASKPTIDTGYEQRMAEWRAGGMTGNTAAKPAASTNRTSLNLYDTGGGGNQEQNFVTINGKKYTQDANGQWNIPLGMANTRQPLTQAWQGPN